MWTNKYNPIMNIIKHKRKYINEKSWEAFTYFRRFPHHERVWICKVHGIRIIAYFDREKREQESK